LNRCRLAEEFATDTWFASVTALGGIDCTQLFVGLKSSFTATYGMSNEAQGSIALEDFIREYGAPYHLRSDNSKMQTGHLFTSICRRYNISQSWTEPHHQQQNPAERRIQDIKRVVNQILDRSGAPEELWFLCTEYIVYLLNRTSLLAINGKTAIEVMTGGDTRHLKFITFRILRTCILL
jgi:transposase InsO family protein